MNSTQTTNYKGQTITKLAIARKAEHGTVTKWTLYSVRNAQGKVISYGISIYRPGAVSPGDTVVRSKKEAMRNFPTAAEGWTIELLG